ncbi:RNA polymerase sigma factor [Flavilitoribacter nigricans]|uniref:RNA polymerase subunit sigma-24 n=1 Tax=Flavilitoribacter nigricans (strain ATCC 23147 / DSM 23189 / NBRC 102662 / NCIMB 1420 / SS-2) TaxID=1122177 RepID=A0A2D0N5R1_FLAN2|nr:RNA polymerase sigma factor [Flavilitoribacter nigricans]PHN03730.1 RNA polymerase subunit sigma-24 [Flavilitoribacter nigricans DSM 23189 = NBRC 102662]
MSEQGAAEKQISDWPDDELVAFIIQEKQAHLRREGQEEIYRRYSGKVYHKCISLIKDSDTARDLTHDIFIKIFFNLDRFKAKGPFYSWVFAITYNRCFDYLNKRKRFQTVDITEVPQQNEIENTELQYKLFKEAKLEALEAAFKNLKAQERMVLSMYYQDKMSIKSMAILLKAGESAVKMRLKRSREHLAELIKSSHDEK